MLCAGAHVGTQYVQVRSLQPLHSVHSECSDVCVAMQGQVVPANAVLDQEPVADCSAVPLNQSDQARLEVDAEERAAASHDIALPSAWEEQPGGVDITPARPRSAPGLS